MIRYIQKDEPLNINHYALEGGDSSSGNSPIQIKVLPFKSCYPHNRGESFKIWERIACVCFPYDIYHSIKFDEMEFGTQKYIPEYTVNHWVQGNGDFVFTSKTGRNLFRHDKAVEAIMKVLKDTIIPEINNIIKMKADLTKMMECFPDLLKDKELSGIKSDIMNIKDFVGWFPKDFPLDKNDSLMSAFAKMDERFAKVEKQVNDINKYLDSEIPVILPTKPPRIIKRKRAGK
jgi:hypothetical protein